jgi:hypothetical protein
MRGKEGREGGRLTWIYPLHAIRERVFARLVVEINAYCVRIVLWQGAVGVQVVASPSGIGDDGVRAGPTAQRDQEEEERGPQAVHIVDEGVRSATQVGQTEGCVVVN